MDLLENSFHLLGATTRDNRHRIMNLAEERSLLADADACLEAQAILTNPRRRISAEVAWLPGVDPWQTAEILRRLEYPNLSTLNSIKLTHIARANLLVSGLSRLPNLASTNIVEWILSITQVSDAINSEEVRTTLNTDRSVSGFSEITDLSAIEDGIRAQRHHYRQVITSVLENLSINERASVLTQAVEISTGNDKTQCPVLIEELILSFEITVQNFLESKEKIIVNIDEKLRAMVDIKNPDTTLHPVVNQLIEAVKEWDTIAQPIQLSKKSRGERHTASFEIAWRIRELAIYLWNEHQKLDFSQQIINMLKEVFAEVIEVDEHITADSAVLNLQAITTQVEQIKEASDAYKPDYILSQMVNKLVQTLKTWDTTTQPTEAHEIVADAGRYIALHLWNERQKLDLSILITETLIEVFRGVNEVTDQLSEDIVILYAIDQQRKRGNTGYPTGDQQRERGSTGCLLKIVVFVTLGLIGWLTGC